MVHLQALVEQGYDVRLPYIIVEELGVFFVMLILSFSVSVLVSVSSTLFRMSSPSSSSSSILMCLRTQ